MNLRQSKLLYRGHQRCCSCFLIVLQYTVATSCMHRITSFTCTQGLQLTRKFIQVFFSFLKTDMAEGTTTPEMLDRTSERSQIKDLMEQSLSNGDTWYKSLSTSLMIKNTLTKSVYFTGILSMSIGSIHGKNMLDGTNGIPVQVVIPLFTREILMFQHF